MSDEGAVAWLRQVIEGDKAAAVAATPGPWAFEGDDITDDELYSVHDGEHGDLVGQTVAFTRHRQVANGEHMARHDPQNVVADCEAKLAILDEHYILTSNDQNEAYEEFSVYRFPSHDCDFGCVCCHYMAQGAVRNYGYCRTVRHLASGYRHREGYAGHWEALAAKEGA